MHSMHVKAGRCRFTSAWLCGRLWHAGSAVPVGVRGLGPGLGWRAARVRQPLKLVQLAIHLLLHLEHLRRAGRK